ncbi:EamA family transporter [Paracoccus methylovorus]|uniref:EamA family transporter n=2 Tax=Paracoccus methylovorus TaxID=2812658 RepID=A0ABX7JKT1_9RHOB|nr:EamA family transporter [Paracoccus methylovorus]
MAGSGIGFLAILWMGIAGSVLAYLFWNVGIAVRGPGKTSIFFNFVPVFALMIEITLGTIPHLVQIIGIAITICGVLVGQGLFSTMASKGVS